MIIMLLKGFLLGTAIILPGMSGGTVLVILGIYEQIIKDMAKLNIKPYLPLLCGAALGIFASSSLFSFFFESHVNATLAFLLGCLLASIRSVLNNCPKLNVTYVIILLGGFLIGLFSAGEPIELAYSNDSISFISLFLGGAVASAAMIIPGISGSSVLVLMGIYDNVLLYLSELNVVPLLFFIAGGLVGAVSLIKLMDKLYKKYQAYISYFFAGIILGSSRAVFPGDISLSVILTFLIAFIITWTLGKDKTSTNFSLKFRS